MQTRDKKRNLFRGYRHGNKSMPKLTGHIRQKSTADDDDDDDDDTSRATLLETALEKANAAVVLDSANNTLGAIDAYEEAVRLLKDILRTASQDDHTRLQKICDSYVERIRALTSTLTTTPTEQPAETAETTSEPTVVKDMQTITEAISPVSSSSSSWRLPLGKRKIKSRPTSIVHDDNDDAASAYTVDSAKTAASGSLFASLFAKKGFHAKYSKDYASTHDLSSSSGPKPSRSTPIAPFNRSPRMWLQQADRKKRHSSDFVDKEGNEQLPPPSLPLPELATTPNNGDYFDLGSVGARDLLLNESSSRYSVLKKPSHATKEASTEENENHNEKRSSIVSKLSVTHDPGNVTQTSAQTKVNDAMDTLAKVLEEVEPASSPPPELASESETEPAFIPPPRKQSMPKRHSKKDSHDSATVVTDEEDRRSTPLVPSSSNNNGQGLSSFWRAHTFSTRRSNQQRSSKKKQEPNLPPLNLQNSSSTRVRSGSNASATSRKSVASSSSPTSVSSPSSQTSSRNGWSSFDMQSRPNTLLFSASMPSLVLSPKERTQFSSSEPKIDPAVFLGSPEPNAGVNDLPLTQRILRCLIDGGYLTDKLYVPKQVWHQTNVRLPAVDAKVAACELLIPVLERMSSLQNYDQNQLTEATKELTTLEQVLEQIKECFARKLKLTEHTRRNDASEEASEAQASGTPEKSSTSYHHLSPSSTVSTNKTSTIAAWSNKLSKSVERMKLESSRTSDYHHSTYIQALIQLFTSAQVLDSWRMQYTEIIGRVTQDKVLSYALLLSRLQACAEALEKIVCAFVLRDFTLLLNKWLKRSREWSLEQ